TSHVEEARKARRTLIADYYLTRENLRAGEKEAAKKGATAAPPYKPLKPDVLYLTDKEWDAALAKVPLRTLSPFAAPDGMHSTDAGGKLGRDFAPERASESGPKDRADRINVFDAAAAHVRELQKAGKRVAVACW